MYIRFGFFLLCFIIFTACSGGSPAVDTSPTLTKVMLVPEKTDTGVTLNINVFFTDPDNDATTVDFEIVSSTLEDATMGNIKLTEGKNQTSETLATAPWRCGKGSDYEIRATATIIDAKDQKSSTEAFTLTCKVPFSAPVLSSVSAAIEQTPEGKNHNLTVFYSDADGDATTLDFEIVSSTLKDASIGDAELTKGAYQKNETEQAAGTWGCGLSQSYELELSVAVVDEQGLRSESKTLGIDCTL